MIEDHSMTLEVERNFQRAAPFELGDRPQRSRSRHCNLIPASIAHTQYSNALTPPSSLAITWRRNRTGNRCVPIGRTSCPVFTSESSFNRRRQRLG
eukprot:2018831-Rhodomonas_salina.2